MTQSPLRTREKEGLQLKRREKGLQFRGKGGGGRGRMQQLQEKGGKENQTFDLVRKEKE